MYTEPAANISSKSQSSSDSSAVTVSAPVSVAMSSPIELLVKLRSSKSTWETRMRYHAAKTLADKIAHQHPVDITVQILGLYVPDSPINSRDSSGANDFVYALIANGIDSYSKVIPVGHMIDVRDVARAHLLALSRSDKRFIISARSFTWKEFADLYRKERPELKDRLPREDVEQGIEQTSVPLDVDFANDALGMGEYVY
ncbi:hypothetical protein K435DRAFT_839563 [Dendrothele bispora CBS 962.96]|uniref:Uncharacterized protein n=1 Tax=Dendrothele bispora (strain CBS 962.96) TaxID=1314807 RepID=A0A4S8LZW8_DENBC|nr:hypothetical protein K435DRAFT_839563 [Dendrothele bispora CBS 962.96]